MKGFDDFRAPATAAEVARRDPDALTPRQRELLTTWGYPYVLDEFRFHLTLTDRIREGQRAAVERALGDWFAPLLGAAVPVDALTLFTEAGPGAPFALQRRAPAAAGPAGNDRKRRSSMTRETVLSNARIVLGDEVRHGSVLIRDGLIADIGTGTGTGTARRGLQRRSPAARPGRTAHRPPGVSLQPAPRREVGLAARRARQRRATGRRGRDHRARRRARRLGRQCLGIRPAPGGLRRAGGRRRPAARRSRDPRALRGLLRGLPRRVRQVRRRPARAAGLAHGSHPGPAPVRRHGGVQALLHRQGPRHRVGLRRLRHPADRAVRPLLRRPPPRDRRLRDRARHPPRGP